MPTKYERRTKDKLIERIRELEVEVDDTFTHWHKHSRRNYLRLQEALIKNAKLEAELEKQRNKLNKLEVKLWAIECAECEKTLLDCECG